MFSTFAKTVAAGLPEQWQQSLKRRHFRRQIRRGTFFTDEPEWQLCAQWLRPGDWAVDVGANIGHYTKRFSDLVGVHGRVISFEPVPETFELLAANAAQFMTANTTLLNLAASDETRVLGVSIPRFNTGLKNYYGAALTTAGGSIQVMTCAIDALSLSGPVRLLKIDAEGHDPIVLRGAWQLISRLHPTIVIESVTDDVTTMLSGIGYQLQTISGSSNTIYRHPAS